jgi:hypothetical protein
MRNCRGLSGANAMSFGWPIQREGAVKPAMSARAGGNRCHLLRRTVSDIITGSCSYTTQNNPPGLRPSTPPITFCSQETLYELHRVACFKRSPQPLICKAAHPLSTATTDITSSIPSPTILPSLCKSAGGLKWKNVVTERGITTSPRSQQFAFLFRSKIFRQEIAHVRLTESKAG